MNEWQKGRKYIEDRKLLLSQRSILSRLGEGETTFGTQTSNASEQTNAKNKEDFFDIPAFIRRRMRA